MPWERLEPPFNGPKGFTFSGRGIVSPLASIFLSESDIREVTKLLMEQVDADGTVEFCQVFMETEKKMVVFCVDTLRAELREMISEKERVKRDHWLMVLPPEVVIA